MYKNKKIAIIIPALNEEDALPTVIQEIPIYIDRVIVADNGSTDRTARYAALLGAEVCYEKRKGYGWACLKGMSLLKDEDIIVFLDGDNSDYPNRVNLLLDPIIDSDCQLVISNRFTRQMEKGSMSFPQRFGNKLSVFLIKLLWGFHYKDLGPFRSITKEALLMCNMSDKNYGWTIELQIKAIQKSLRICQVDVPYRRRVLGKSKVSGTILGVIKAGFKILWKIFFYKCISKR